MFNARTLIRTGPVRESSVLDLYGERERFCCSFNIILDLDFFSIFNTSHASPWRVRVLARCARPTEGNGGAADVRQ